MKDHNMHIVLLIDHFAKFVCFPYYLALFRWLMHGMQQQQQKKNTFGCSQGLPALMMKKYS